MLLKEIKDSYAALIVKHEEYAMFLNDEKYYEVENWLNECSRSEEVSAVSIEINNQPSTQPSSDNLLSSESQSTETGNTGEVDVPPIKSHSM